MQLLGLLGFAALAWMLWSYFRDRPARAEKPARRAAEKRGVQRLEVPGEEVSFGKDWRKMNALYQSIVGEQHYTAAHDSFLAGASRRVEIIRELDNPHDPNALAVFGIWVGQSGECREKLGYLPRAFAAEVAATRPVDMEIRAKPIYTDTSRRGDYRNMKVDLYEPSVRSGYWREQGVPAPRQVSST